MSRRHRMGRDNVRHEKPQAKSAGAFVSSFSENIGVELNSTTDLMNWIIFGNTKDKMFSNNNDF